MFSCRQVAASTTWDSWNGGRSCSDEQSESIADEAELLCMVVGVVVVVAATKAVAAEAVASHVLFVAEGEIWLLASQGNGVGGRGNVELSALGRLTARPTSIFWSCLCPGSSQQS